MRWWDEEATTYRSAAMLSPTECAALPDLPIPAHARIARTDKPVFFGHYWLTGTPSLQSRQAVCVDYSAGSGGPLVAYRFDSSPNCPLNVWCGWTEMAVDYLHRLLVSGKPADVRAFRDAIYREYPRTIAGETFTEIAPFSFAGLYELAPAARRV